MRARLPLLFLLAFCASAKGVAISQDLTFQFDSQRTVVNFTLGDVLHTVRGTFELKQGSLHLDAASGRLSGEILVNAKSGKSGSAMRDRKMQREVLESERYPNISFRPDRIEGSVALQGKSSVQIHGIFNIHGSDHELTAPAEVEVSSNHWAATLHFAVPYAKWGMKNPSTLFLRVNDSVEIDVNAEGTVAQP